MRRCHIRRPPGRPFSHMGRPDLVFAGWGSSLPLRFPCCRTKYPPNPSANQPSPPGMNLAICSPCVGVAGAWVGLPGCRVEEKRMYTCNTRSRSPSAASAPPWALANCLQTPSSDHPCAERLSLGLGNYEINTALLWKPLAAVFLGVNGHLENRFTG